MTKFENLPPEISGEIFEPSVTEWLATSTSQHGPRGTWSAKSRQAFEDLRNYWTVNGMIPSRHPSKSEC